MATYSQHGEDTAIEEIVKILGDRIPQVVVDVGAGDGMFLSNSHLFIGHYGWEGYLFEPTEDPYQSLIELYKDNDKVRCFPIALTEKRMAYSMQQGWMGSETHWTLSNVKDDPESKLITNRLSDFIKVNRIRDIGLLTIDAEGSDTGILRDLVKNSKIRPHIICIESLSSEMDKEHCEILEKNYYLYNQIQFNQIFVLKTHEKNLSRRVA